VAHAQPVFDATHIGELGSGKDAELVRPAGPGPFPAVVVMHGCNGVAPHYRGWAQTLRNWGYAALLVNSFNARGKYNVCNHGLQVPPQERARDAYQAADWLRAQSFVRRTAIGVIGFSHGGWAVMNIVMSATASRLGGTPFAAAVAYYPYCEDSPAAVSTDVLVLIGDADDWTSAARCQKWAASVDRAGHTVELKVYPGARHAFDSAEGMHMYAGHYVGRDASAAPDAEQRTRNFFAARLR